MVCMWDVVFVTGRRSASKVLINIGGWMGGQMCFLFVMGGK